MKEKHARNSPKVKNGLPVKEYNFDVNILTILVKKILEEVRHRLVGDMSTHDDMPVWKVSKPIHSI